MGKEQEAQEQIAREEAAGPGPEPAEPRQLVVDTAFVIFVQDGVAYATNDLGEVSVTVEGQSVSVEPMRRASPDDLYRYSTEVAKDVQVSQTAAATAMQIFEITKQLQGQVPGQGGGPRGLHLPGR